jgi:diacylglycerol kinase (ATP)
VVSSPFLIVASPLRLHSQRVSLSLSQAAETATPLDSLILTPQCIVMNAPGVFSFQPKPDATPLLCFVNPKSGSNQGTKLMAQLRKILNPRQVFNLLEPKPDGDGVIGPNKGLLLFKDCPRLRVLVAGGDGTVGWVLDVIDKLGLADRQIPVCFLPLGTGNDLSRCACACVFFSSLATSVLAMQVFAATRQVRVVVVGPH